MHAVGATDQGLHGPLNSCPRYSWSHLWQSVQVAVTPGRVWPYPQHSPRCFLLFGLLPCTKSKGILDDLHLVVVLVCISHYDTAACYTPSLHKLGACELQRRGRHLSPHSQGNDSGSRNWPQNPQIDQWSQVHQTTGRKHTSTVHRYSYGSSCCPSA